MLLLSCYMQVTELIFPSSNTLADFVNYVFTRRYGWSEVVPTGEQTLSVQRIHGVGSSSKNEGVMKSQLNELLDDLLKWWVDDKVYAVAAAIFIIQVSLNECVCYCWSMLFTLVAIDWYLLSYFRMLCQKLSHELISSLQHAVKTGKISFFIPHRQDLESYPSLTKRKAGESS